MKFILFFTTEEIFTINCAMLYAESQLGKSEYIGTTKRKLKKTLSVVTLTLLEIQTIFESVSVYVDFYYNEREQDPEDDDLIICSQEEKEIVNTCFTIQKKIIAAMGAADDLDNNNDDDDFKPPKPNVPNPSNGGVTMQ